MTFIIELITAHADGFAVVVSLAALLYASRANRLAKQANQIAKQANQIANQNNALTARGQRHDALAPARERVAQLRRDRLPWLREIAGDASLLSDEIHIRLRRYDEHFLNQGPGRERELSHLAVDLVRPFERLFAGAVIWQTASNLDSRISEIAHLRWKLAHRRKPGFFTKLRRATGRAKPQNEWDLWDSAEMAELAEQYHRQLKNPSSAADEILRLCHPLWRKIEAARPDLQKESSAVHVLVPSTWEPTSHEEIKVEENPALFRELRRWRGALDYLSDYHLPNARVNEPRASLEGDQILLALVMLGLLTQLSGNVIKSNE